MLFLQYTDKLISSPSPEKTPRPLLAIPHDRFLPRRLLPCRPGRHWQPRRRWRLDERIPRLYRVEGEQLKTDWVGAGVQVVFVHDEVEGGDGGGKGKG